MFSSYVTWFLPHTVNQSIVNRLTRNWVVTALAAVRSGSPFTVYATQDTGYGLYNNRSNLLDPEHARTALPYTGGEIILNDRAFEEPADGVLGTSGRNAFYGPGAYNLDLSIGRTYAVLHREWWRLTVRLDAFNVLNHANLNNPTGSSSTCCSTFETTGLALYGRTNTNAGLPLIVPLAETARQLHLIVRMTF